MGRRRMFVIGVAVFVVASLLGGIAQDSAWLLVCRGLQGAAAALASPAALALINTTFPSGKERNRAMAVYAAMSGGGAAIGLILGGALTEYLNWRWTFFINVPLGLISAVLAPRVLVESESANGSLDIWGAVLATAGFFGIVYGLSHAARASWTDAQTLISLIGGVVLLGIFALVERNAKNPLLPLRVLTDRARATSLFAMLMVGGGVLGMFYFIGLYIQQVLGYSPVVAGLAFLPFSATLVVMAAVTSRLVSRFDPRWVAGTGAILATAALWYLTRLTTASSYAGSLLPSMAILGVGIGLIFLPLTSTATARISSQDHGAAGAALNTANQIGAAIGIAALTTVYSHYANQKRHDLAATTHQAAMQAQTYGSTHAFWFAAGFMLIAALTILGLLNVHRQEIGANEEVVAA